jgi:arginine/lysine/ornithine decarboxylase
MKHAPLYEALINHAQKNKWSFHVPGHKNGQVFEKNAAPFFRTVLPLDVTELTGLDDLHHPEGPIKEAQDLLADFYGVDKSYFLVGGSTSGNHAMILAAFGQEDIVLVQRNCHKSVLNGLELAGATPVFLTPENDEVGGIPLGVSFTTVQKAVELYPQIKGIILTNPTYYGMQQDISDITGLIHDIGGVVLVDEAHGAHFGLKEMPESAIHKGADVVVQSAHKTLPALTMGAFLHVNSDTIKAHRIEHALQMVQSSSPSYLIMASLDLSRLYLENLTQDDITYIVDQSHEFRLFIDSVPHFQTVKPQEGYTLDPLKVTVQSDREISGYKLQRLFEAVGLFTELADEKNVLFILPLGKINELDELKEAFVKISKQLFFYKKREKTESSHKVFPSISKLQLSYTAMKKMDAVLTLMEHAEGYIAAESVVPYPPGIPLISKGEKITSELLHHYFFLKEKGARFQGVNEHYQMYVFDNK